jgi:hypothetical protein
MLRLAWTLWKFFLSSEKEGLRAGFCQRLRTKVGEEIGGRKRGRREPKHIRIKHADTHRHREDSYG